MYTTTGLIHHAQSLALLKIRGSRVQGLVASCLWGAGHECSGHEAGARRTDSHTLLILEGQLIGRVGSLCFLICKM